MTRSGNDDQPRSSLGKTSFGISLLAGLSLLFGFLVDGTLALFFGAGPHTDAFFIATTVPFAVGSLLLASTNQALVPLFNTWLNSETPTEAARRIGGLFGAILVAAGLIAALGIALSPVLPNLLAPGSPDSVRSSAVPLTALMFGTVLFRAGSEVLRSLLNAHFSFYVPAASPVAQSAVVITVAFLFANQIGVLAFGMGYLAGSIVQFAWLAIAASRRNVMVRPRWAMRDAVVRDGLRLLTWPVGSSALNIFGRWAERFIASFLPVGSITVLSYAWRIINGIGGSVFFRSVTVAILPRLREAVVDRNETRHLMRTGLLIMTCIAIPLTAGVVALAGPAVNLIYLRGEFTTGDAVRLAGVLAIYSASFPMTASARVLLSYFFARLEVVSPFKNQIVMVGTNVVTAVPLAMLLGIEGLAFAFVLSAGAALMDGWRRTSQHVDLSGREISRFAAKMFLASAGAGLMVQLLLRFLPDPNLFSGRVLAIAIKAAVFAAVLVFLMWMLKLNWAFRWIWKEATKSGR